MTQLSEQQKELLFGYCLGITSEVENAQIQELIFSSDEAAKFVASIKASLSPLDSVMPEQCPEELADGTVWRAQQAVRTSQLKLNELLAAEQGRKPSVKEGLWHNIFGRLATAALFVIVGSILISGGQVASKYAHQKYWQTQCATQLGGLFNSLNNYKADYADQMPAVASTPGSPWWKIGYQGPENYSNTRRMWLLVRKNYAGAGDFMCPAQKTDVTFSGNPNDYNDFPSRKLVTYSFRIGCPKGEAGDLSRRIIISDMNPIFAVIPSPNERLQIVQISDKNSPNHSGRGQNALFCDGSVKFLKTRFADVSLDDIFTLQNTQTYEGTELPASDKDIFLAP
jgi:prepilin-type processing-associated H-X9-DG protein